MPVMNIGFQLKPLGFFDGNPGLDVAVVEQCQHPNGHH